MKNMKRCLALVLTLCLLVGFAPAYTNAATVEDKTTELNATEIPGLSRLENTGEQAEQTAQYADHEMVTVIVLMEDPAVMDFFGISTFNDEESSDLTAGEAVSEFLASDGAQELAQELLDGQQAIIEEIETIVEEVPAQDEMVVVAQWTGLVNGMAITVPYGSLAQINELPGVLNAYVQRVFESPAKPETDAGNAGYSYDLVNLNSVWSSGYYGEGMLVAVLDTGLDLEYSSWGDSADLTTGVRRVHEAFTEDSFKTEEGKTNVRYTEAGMEAFLERTQLYANTGSEGQLVIYDGNALYKNKKVPFAFDYCDWDLNARPIEADHGTHVAGTVAGYVETEEGEVVFSGVAPDAQIIAMKVFDDYGSSYEGMETSLVCALEDAAKLGADVINLSLGSDNGFAIENTVGYFVYENLRESGILFMISAGNSAYSSLYNNRGDYNLSSDPEISMMSTPASYGAALSIASMDNTVSAESVMAWTDTDGTKTEISYADPYDVAMKSMFAGEEVAIIPVDGYGTYYDYYNAGFRSYYGYSDKGVSGIALVKRGGTDYYGNPLTFEDKINQATSFVWSYYDSAKGQYVTEYPVKAVIIYDEDPNATELIYMSVENALVTSCFISGKDGAALYDAAKAAMESGSTVTLTVEKEDRIVANETAGQMSSFSSWGATPGLELKPDITAPGGNIWSTVLDYSYVEGSGAYDDYTGSYGMMSGTSMAAPHMTGITALVKQYVKEALNLSGTEAANITEMLLVSTAVPQSDGNTYYSPRMQGAGLVNAGAAITSPAYISVEGQNVGKLELKDDPNKTGSYTLTFQVNNLTGETLTYNAVVSVLRPGTTTEDGNTYMLDSDVLLKEVNLGTVTVPANGSVTVSETVTLTDEEKAELDELFPNGTYIEGFVTLTNDTDPQIGLPFLAFYGDWTAAPIFDSATWIDDDVTWNVETESWNADTTWGVTLMGYFDGYAFYNLGQNPFDPTAMYTQEKYLEENITVSPTGLFKTINDANLYQLRDSKVMVVEVKDKETGEVYYHDIVGYLTKTLYDYSYGVGVPWSAFYYTETYWDGTDLEGNVLPSGTQCVYTITAYGDGEYGTTEDSGYLLEDLEGVIPGENEPTFNGHAMDKTGDVIEFDVMVDTVAPKLVDSTVSTYVEDGRTYITGTFKDDGSIASVEIYPQVKRTYNLNNYPNADASYYEYGLDENNPFYSEMIYDADTQEWTFTADVTDYAHTNESYSGENYSYNFEWTGNVYIFSGDYGGNDRAYAVTVNTGDGLILSTTSAKLHVGESFDLNVINNTGSDAHLTRTSTNPDVATVDEFGHIVAIAPGQTEIVISNGTEEVICIVAVEEEKTEVIDFDLSLEYFDGLKPDGSIIVKVTNLEPADVTITENIWSVTEDDPVLYAGLINCSKYTTDGMSAEVYLNYDTNTELAIPGASGTLSVTLNGVTRTVDISWEDLYTARDQDGVISENDYGQQTYYVELGQTAELVAKYRQTHSFINVELYSAENCQSYGYNELTPCEGLVLDGPTFTTNGARWEGKLVALPGYELPESIRVFTRYDYGYESEKANYSWSQEYSYDPETGEIVVFYSPYGATNTLVIRADGVASEGAPGGTLSGIEYTKPDGQYGPFDWEVTNGSGELTTGTVEDYYESKDAAFYTPSEVGVSYITATSKDDTYSVNFAVVCTGVQAEKLDLEEHNVTLHVGENYQLDPTLSPEPTLDIDKRLTYTSFNEDVVTVDENGKLTAVSEGYAYICIEVASGVDVETYCVVQVLPCEEHSYGEWTETKAPACEAAGEESRTCANCGNVETREIPATGHSYTSVVTDPTATEKGYTTHTCSNCGDSYVDSYTDATGSSADESTDGDKTPGTGDHAPLLLLTVLMVLSAAALVTLPVIRKKRVR